MTMSLNALKKLSKEELSNMVIDYQSKFDNMLSHINAELTSVRDRLTKMESQLSVTRRVNDNLLKQNRILERKCAANEHYSRRECLELSGIPDSIPNNNLEETVLKIFNETGVTVNSRDVEACHRLNQKANPKKVIIKLSKRKDVTRVMNNKKKLKSMKPQNIGLPSGCKVYINESLCKYYKYLWWKCKLLQTRGSIQSFWVTNGSIRIRHQNDEVTSVTHIEDLERHFLEEDLCDNNDDGDSAN